MDSFQLSKNIALLCLMAALILAVPAGAGTTQLRVVRYASDNTTVIGDRTVTYTWMEANMPVWGDGVTHYYHQGPVFLNNPDEAVEQQLRWNPEESVNCYPDKDMGAVKGTNARDLCNLTGGMKDGDLLKVIAADGWSMWFAYKNVYQYTPREGPMVVTWYRAGEEYVPGYYDGMRLVWFADTSVNQWTAHIFGNNDWKLAASPGYYYYFQNGEEKYPTTTGLSGYNISTLAIYSQVSPPVPIQGYTKVPTDPDGDGLFEDLNANGNTDFNDVFVFFKKLEWIESNEPKSLFDFNKNGNIDFNDVFRLFKEV